MDLPLPRGWGVLISTALTPLLAGQRNVEFTDFACPMWSRDPPSSGRRRPALHGGWKKEKKVVGSAGLGNESIASQDVVPSVNSLILGSKLPGRVLPEHPIVLRLCQGRLPPVKYSGWQCSQMKCIQSFITVNGRGMPVET